MAHPPLWWGRPDSHPPCAASPPRGPPRGPPIRIDDLTRLPLRSAFVEAAAASIDQARAARQTVSLLVIDVDHFKLINDTFGHLQGDDVLVEVAELLRKNLRGYDIAARYAGDEFVALLPDTSIDGAREVGARFCAAVRSHVFRLRDGQGAVPVTVSVGIAAAPDHGDDYDAVFAAGDRALYRVKRQGRDGLAVAQLAGEEPTHLPLGIERFVGRVQELRSLVRYLEDATEGKPRVVAISGEAGVGKTTLLRQLEPEVRLRAGSLVAGRCHEADVQPPYAPWAEAIGAIRRLDMAPHRAWRELPHLVPALAADAPKEAQAASKYMLLEEIAEYIRIAAAERPLVIVLDDMQWADVASWDTLEYLLPQLENERLLICLTIRAEETFGESLERRRRLSRNEMFHELNLSRLTREELKTWVEAAFHRQDVGREFLAFLYRQTEGNPLFVVQVLRTLVDEGAIWYTGERWEWRPVSELRLPLAVSDLISRRLSRLSPKAHGILMTAAVIGREFEIDLALEAGAGAEEELLDAVDEAVRASVLQSAAQRGGDRYAFTHGLMAEVLRGSVNARRLRRIHERVAQALERRRPTAIAEIATHYDRAGNQDRAYAFACEAAERAESVYAHAEGTEFLRMAERNATTPAQLAEVRVRLAQIAEAVGRYDEAEELCDLAVEWFAGQGDADRALGLRRMRERVRSALGQPARRTLDSCLALAEEAASRGLDEERAALLQMISQCYGRLGDARAAERIAWECVHISERVGSPKLLADSLLRLGITIAPDHGAQAIEIYSRALEIYRGLGDYLGQARCHNNMGVAYQFRGDWVAAQAEYNTCMTLARTAGSVDLWGLATVNIGLQHMKNGDYDRARDLFGEALALFAAVKNSEKQLYALYNLAYLDRERGEFATAEEMYAVASALAQRIGQNEVEVGALAGAGLAALEQEKLEEARAAYRAVMEKLNGRADWFQGRELVEALRIRLAARDGDGDAAVRQFLQAHELADSTDAYSAAWLTVVCADSLLSHDRGRIRGVVSDYAGRVRELGYSAMTERYEALLARA